MEISKWKPTRQIAFSSDVNKWIGRLLLLVEDSQRRLKMMENFNVFEKCLTLDDSKVKSCIASFKEETRNGTDDGVGGRFNVGRTVVSDAWPG